MIFNILIKQQIYADDYIYVEFQPEPYKYRDKYCTGYTIYDFDNADELINAKKEEIRIHYYNDIASYDNSFISKYEL